MRIAVIGAEGQLGRDLLPLLGDEAIGLGHSQIEITDAESVRNVLAASNAEFVVNVAAYNLVDRAEEEPEVAFRVNALGPRNLAIECARRDIPLMHVSSDYVFGLDERRTTPYLETDPPGPVSAYGTSKLTGEYFVRSLCRRHFVVRTCGLYGRGGARGKGNFVETMLRLADERDELRIVDDQRCTPTSTADLARVLKALIERREYGFYHATNGGDATWCEFAREIFRLAGRDVRVVPISSAEFGAPARRPGYSVLESSKLESVVGTPLRDWREALADYLNAREIETEGS